MRRVQARRRGATCVLPLPVENDFFERYDDAEPVNVELPMRSRSGPW
jgi:hypothetical protein